jgi:TonB family protein
MFGFGRQKCRQCGEALESMGQSGDRRDDLLKSSAILQNKAVGGLCARCRAVASASGQHRGAAAASPPVSVPRTIAQSADQNAEAPVGNTPTAYEPGGSFKTETEQQADSSNPISTPISYADTTDGRSLLIWLLTTKTGRNVALVSILLFIGLMRNCSFDDQPEITDQPVTTETSTSSYRPPEAATAIPAGNPGDWVTSGDYPARALAEGREGKAGFNLVVNSKGRPEICTIISSSTHADLDKATCDALMKRARFDSDAGSNALRNYRSNVRWKIPGE